jgi:hypothetical protein
MTRLRPVPEAIAFAAIKFRNGDDILSLWPEQVIHDGGATWHVGWCPELRNTMFVHANNVVEDKA